MRASKKAKQLVFDRAQGRCEICGVYPNEYSFHHRLTLGMGGSRRADLNGPANLLFLCGSGVTGCHGWVTGHFTQSQATGWVVSRWADPREAPVLVFLRQPGAVLLDDAGNYVTESKPSWEHSPDQSP